MTGKSDTTPDRATLAKCGRTHMRLMVCNATTPDIGRTVRLVCAKCRIPRQMEAKPCEHCGDPNNFVFEDAVNAE